MNLDQFSTSPSQGDVGVYVFAGVERYLRRPAESALSRSGMTGRAKPRVYELAAELGVQNKIVMMKLPQAPP